MGILSGIFKLISPFLFNQGVAYLKHKFKAIDDDTYSKIKKNYSDAQVQESDIMRAKVEQKLAETQAHTAEIQAYADLDIKNIDADLKQDREIRRLNKRRYSDDIVRIGLLALVIACFIPPAQSVVLDGVNILSALPWFVQTIIIIACINLIGGYALLSKLIAFKRSVK